jgi:hypothetical protein
MSYALLILCASYAETLISRALRRPKGLFGPHVVLVETVGEGHGTLRVPVDPKI